MDLLAPVLVFLGVVFGGGFALATFFPRAEPLERLALGVGAALLAVFLGGFALYVLDLPRELRLVLPAALAAVLFVRRPELRPLLEAPVLRYALASWALFAVWGLGLLLCIEIYGGGWWAGDWLEHFQRARFWQLGGDPAQRFLYDVYSLGARPPLANVIGGVLLGFSGGGFVRHLVLNTLLGSLVLFPFLLLARRWAPSGRESAAGAFALLVLLVSPFVAQNLTFGWTRHLTAFWVLLGAHLLLRGLRSEGDGAARRLGFLALAAGFLAHYSAGPAIVVAVLAYLWHSRCAIATSAWLTETSRHALLCGGLIGVWFAWSVPVLGGAETFGSNTTAQFAAAQTPAENARVFLLNLRDTLVPHAFRDPGFPAVGEQASAAGRARDFFFNLYQINLPLMFGFGGLAALLFHLAGKGSVRAGGVLAVLLYVLVGVGVHTTRDHLGLGHICLQPLVLLGLARIAAFLADAPAAVRRIWAVGAGLDFTLGIALHFALLTHRFGDARDYCMVVLKNTRALADHGLTMPRPALGPPDWLLLLVLGAVLAFALRSAARATRSIPA